MNQSRSNPDWSTINLSALKARPVYTIPSAYRLDDSPGKGCAGDPPGFPTYFLRSIYNQNGNTPSNAPEDVILYSGKVYDVTGKDESYDSDKREARMLELWQPLPEDHSRTVAWMQATYIHQGGGYIDREGVVVKPQYGRSSTLFYPLTGFWRAAYGFREFKDDPRFSDEWRSKEKAAIEQHNAELLPKIEAITIPENLNAANIIRRYYPNHQPRMDWVEHPPAQPGNWWETATAPPPPEECPGQYSMKHPANGSWCQWCGWQAPKEPEAKR